MDYKNINHLLDKYWEGETSLKEEDTLKQYFNNGSIAPEHRQFQPLFQFFKGEQDILISDDFEKRLLAELEKEPVAKVRNLNWKRTLRLVAAVGIILLGAIFIFNQLNAPKKGAKIIVLDDFESEEERLEAYEATKAALKLLSGKMKKGSKKASKGLTEVRDAKKRTFK